MAEKIKRRRVTGNLDENLTEGELLLIWRRRMGLNQGEAATQFGCSIFCYKLAEYDRAKDFKYKKNLKFTLRDYEKCLIYRKRSGLTQSYIAKQIGISRYWLRLQEQGQISSTKLLSWWEHDKTKN